MTIYEKWNKLLIAKVNIDKEVIRHFRDEREFTEAKKIMLHAKPLKNEEGKYSAKATLEALTPDRAAVIRFFALYPYDKRKNITKDIRYNQLVPVWMRIQKVKNQIMYEDWSKKKEDSPILNIGKKLLIDILKNNKVTKEDILKGYEKCVKDAEMKQKNIYKNANLLCLRVGNYGVPRYIGYAYMGVWHCSNNEPNLKYMITNFINYDKERDLEHLPSEDLPY